VFRHVQTRSQKNCLSYPAVASVAGADLDLVVALLALLLALDEAAPVELALAPFHSSLAPRRVTPVAAHQLATVDARTSLQKRRNSEHYFFSYYRKILL